MSGAEKGIGLDIVPSARARRSRDYDVGATSDTADPGLDVFYKVTPSLTASLTFNTDFSGTNVDARQINLTRFGLFFPEQRVFFLQDTDIFEFGRIGGDDFNNRTTFSRVERESGRPFFSRRVGLSGDGETIDIVGGGKLTGRAGDWDVGLLGIRQDEFQSSEASDLFVARFSRNVLAESSIGVIMTYGDPDSDFDNTLAGIDFRYLNTRLPNGSIVEGAIWYQQSDTEGLDGNDAAYGVSFRMPNAEGWRAGLSYKELDENFYPALGFVNRVDVSDLSAELGYTYFPAGGAVRSAFSGVDYQRIETLNSELQTQMVTIRMLEMTNHYGDRLEFHYQLNDEVLAEPFEISEGIIIPIGSYAFDQYCVNFNTAEFRPVAINGYYCGGEFFDGDISAPGADVTWRPNEHFRFSVGYHLSDIDLPYGAFDTRLVSLRGDIAFSNTWSWENIIQYDNVSDSMGLNSILRWIPRAGREILLVVNREFIDYTGDYDFRSLTGDITGKFSYTFRF
jgi:hypothetical protein